MQMTLLSPNLRRVILYDIKISIRDNYTIDHRVYVIAGSESLATSAPQACSVISSINFLYVFSSSK
jgi:hypothetical protein